MKKVGGLVLGSSVALMSLIPAASAMAAGLPATGSGGSVTLQAVGSPNAAPMVAPGSNVTFQAQASGITNPEYQFWVEEPNGQWVDAQNYSTSSTFTLNNVQAGNYLVAVYVMTPQQIAAQEWSQAVTTLADGVFVNSAVAVSASPGQPTAGQAVTLTASSQNVSNPQYQFWYKDPSGTWHQSGYYSSSATYTFTPSQTGAYEYVVYVKSPLAVNDHEGALQSTTGSFTVVGAATGVQFGSFTDGANLHTLVEDSMDAGSMTLTVVDANGTPVTNYNGPVDVYIATPNGDTLVAPNAQLAGSPQPTSALTPWQYTAVNGVVTVTVQSGTTLSYTATPVPDVVYAGIPDSTGKVAQWASASVQTALAKKTGLAINAPTTYSTGNPSHSYDVFGGPIPYTLSILDQAGNVMPLSAMAAQNTEVQATVVGAAELGRYNAYVHSGSSYSGVTNGPVTGQTDESSASPSDFYSITPRTSGSHHMGFYLWPVQATGPATLTFTSVGLHSATAIINLVSPNAANHLGLVSGPAATTVTADQFGTYNAPMRYTVAAEDAAGAITGTLAPSAVSVTVLGPNGQSALDVWGTGSYSMTNGEATFTLNYNGASTVPAGQYTVEVQGQQLGTLTEHFTITPGQPYDLALSPQVCPVNYLPVRGLQPLTVISMGCGTDVPITNPVATISAQLMDKWGNPVPESGVPVEFLPYVVPSSSSSGNPNPPGTLSAAGALTNSQGVATVTDALPATLSGPYYLVGGRIDAVWASQNGDPISGGTNYTGDMYVVQNVASSVSVQVTYPKGGSAYQAGEAASYDPTMAVSALDSAGAPIANDKLQVTVTAPNGATFLTTTVTSSSSAPNTLYLTSTGLSGGTLPTNAGTYSVKVTDLSSPGTPSQTASMTVTAAAGSGVAMFQAGSEVAYDYVSGGTAHTGNSGVAVGANQPMTLWVKPIDRYGNPVTLASALTVNLSASVAPSGSTNGFFEVNGVPVTQVTIPAGSSGVAVTYVNQDQVYATFSVAYQQVLSGYTVTGFTPGSSGTATVTAIDQFGATDTAATSAYASFTSVDMVDPTASGESDTLATMTWNSNYLHATPQAITLTAGTTTFSYTKATDGDGDAPEFIDTFTVQNAASSPTVSQTAGGGSALQY